MGTAAALPTSQFVQANGLRLHHLDCGGQGRTPMVLLHGIRLHAHCWSDFSRRQRERYHVMALDARGHGDSAWSAEQDYHLHTYYEDLSHVMDARDLPPAVLVGHSLGARTAMLYTHLHPERVAKLVLVDMGAGLPARARGKDFSRVTETPPPRDFATHEEATDYLHAILRRAPREMIEESVVHGMRPVEGGRLTWKYDPSLGGVPRPRPGVREWDLWEAVRTITCPTLLVRGADSQVVSEEVAARMGEEMADCRVEQIADSGHALFTERPEAFAAVVSDFLGAGDAPRP